MPNSKNQPVVHPAFVVERQAMDELRKWGDRFRPGSKSPAKKRKTTSWS